MRTWLLVVGLLANGLAHAASAPDAYRLVEAQQLERAAEEVAALKRAHPQDPAVAFVEGDLLLHQGRYEAAAERLRAAERGEVARQARALGQLARATAEVTRNFVAKRGPHFVVWSSPGKDELLAGYALETLERAYDALGDDFGYRPQEPVRVEIYPEVADLARVSTLTQKEIETSGTIALCKYNRLMIVSPRALIAGYPWRDTLNHEYTHYVVTRLSHNTVPIWLHEGLAKFEERRWRGPSGGGLTPLMEHLLATALSRKQLVTFAQMSPSMAKLPSQEKTALAFAEVYTVVQYLHEKGGWAGLRALIGRFREGQPIGDFEADWRAWLGRQKLRVHPGLLPEQAALRFKRGSGKETEASTDESSRIGEERARKWARLGGLLRARHRLRAAAIEYEKAQAIIGPGHPAVANKLARTYLELGDDARAIATAEPELARYPEEAAPNATLGAAYLHRGQAKEAARYLEAALAINPFDPAVHCGLKEAYQALSDGRASKEAEVCAALR